MEKTQHCECGNDTYHIKFNAHGDKWAVCADCGRPTGTVGVGMKKQQEWQSESDTEN